jgi:hypothetical protein
MTDTTLEAVLVHGDRRGARSRAELEPPSYVLHLDGTGISVIHADPSR